MDRDPGRESRPDAALRRSRLASLFQQNICAGRGEREFDGCILRPMKNLGRGRAERRQRPPRGCAGPHDARAPTRLLERRVGAVFTACSSRLR